MIRSLETPDGPPGGSRRVARPAGRRSTFWILAVSIAVLAFSPGSRAAEALSLRDFGVRLGTLLEEGDFDGAERWVRENPALSEEAVDAALAEIKKGNSDASWRSAAAVLALMTRAIHGNEAPLKKAAAVLGPGMDLSDAWLEGLKADAAFVRASKWSASRAGDANRAGEEMAWERAALLCGKSGKAELEARALFKLGSVQLEMDLLEKAYDNLGKAVWLMRKDKVSGEDALLGADLAAGSAALRLKKYEDAEDFYTEAADLAGRLGEGAELKAARTGLALAQERAGKIDRAMTALSAAHKAAVEAGDAAEADRTEGEIARLKSEKGDFRGAVRWESMRLERAGPDSEANRSPRAESLGRIAVWMESSGDHEGAIRSAGESASLFREMGETSRTAAALEIVGNARARLGRYDAAVSVYEECARMLEGGGEQVPGSLLANLGHAQLRRGDAAEAAMRLTQALSAFGGENNPAGKRSVLMMLGKAEGETGNLVEGEKHLRQAFELTKNAGDPGALAEIRLGLAVNLTRQGRLREAGRYFDAAAAVFEKQGEGERAAPAGFELGLAFQNAKDPASAAERLKTSGRLMEGGNPRMEIRIGTALAQCFWAMGDRAGAEKQYVRMMDQVDAVGPGALDREEREAPFVEAAKLALVGGRPREALKALERMHVRTAREYAQEDGIRVPPGGLDDWIGALPENSLALAYLVEDGQTLIFAVRRGTVTVYSSPVGREGLERDASMARLDLVLKGSADEAVSRGLYDALIQPVGGIDETVETLVVVPHGPVAGAPFSIFTGPDGRMLEERLNIAAAPSLAAAAGFASNPRAKVKKEVVVFGLRMGEQARPFDWGKSSLSGKKEKDGWSFYHSDACLEPGSGVSPNPDDAVLSMKEAAKLDLTGKGVVVALCRIPASPGDEEAMWVAASRAFFSAGAAWVVLSPPDYSGEERRADRTAFEAELNDGRSPAKAHRTAVRFSLSTGQKRKGSGMASTIYIGPLQ